tara:strand:- start:2110 stop:3621 length:1512 start_codon:yes stop_codon:yes gene_type:complete
MSNLIKNVTKEIKGFANIINWNSNDFNEGQYCRIEKIQRSDLSNNGLFGNLYDLPGTNVINPNDTNRFIDYDISLCKTYEYKLKINDNYNNNNNNPALDSYYKYVYMSVINENIRNCDVSYNFITNRININWDDLTENNSNNNINIVPPIIEPIIHYNAWICLKSENENLLRFDIDQPSDINEPRKTSIDINSGKSCTLVEFQNESENNSVEDETLQTFNIQTGTYFIYVTPKYQTHTTSTTTITRGYPLRYFKKNGKVTGIPLKIITIGVETPENFEIQSAYNNGKISFSWNIPTINPTQYLIRFERETESETETETTDISMNTGYNSINSYTLDNTDLSLDSFKPGDYSVSVKSRFIVDGSVTLESSFSNTLEFNIPITNINFTKQLIDSDGNITTNIKNGVAGIKLTWDIFSYVTYYKITTRQFDDTGQEKNSETYYVAHPIDHITLAWNFPEDQSKFIFNISYTTDTSFNDTPPASSSNALGETYLGEDGVSYDIFINE